MTKNTDHRPIKEMKIILGCILDIILLSFQIMMKRFISVNCIKKSRKVDEYNKSNMIERLNNLHIARGG